MFVLLPPSEAKRPGGAGPAWRDVLGDASRLFGTGTALDDVRLKLLTEVAELSARDPATAAAALKLPAGAVADACARNATVLDAATLAALDRYTGVVYEGLDVATLPTRARRAAERSVLVFSGGLGVVRGGDLVPWYRVPASARLPVAGTVSALWREALREPLTALLDGEFVVDLRSSDYAALWRPDRRANCGVVAVRVLQRRRVGRKRIEQVVSYHSKLVKGRLARALIESAAARRPVSDVVQLGEVAARLGLDVRPISGGLDLVDG